MDKINRISLGFFPTPLHALPKLTEKLGGPRLFVKRDDQTGLATGGNKTRKLEFLVADALAHKADTLITAGAPQSNHARQTAAAAARMGMNCVLVLRGQPPAECQGNLLLDDLLGAQIRWTENECRAYDDGNRRRRIARAGPYAVHHSRMAGATPSARRGMWPRWKN